MIFKVENAQLFRVIVETPESYKEENFNNYDEAKSFGKKMSKVKPQANIKLLTFDNVEFWFGDKARHYISYSMDRDNKPVDVEIINL